MSEMNWVVMLLMSILMPVVQPTLQNGVQKMSAKIQQVSQPSPYITYHEGRWWKLENGQWYVWQENKNAN
jgi:hypothetical protein